jgi:hypothetical protein
MRRTRSLFKYYSERRWAEAFVQGELLFRSLAYFRDYEDEETRGDRNEGTAIHRPRGGLVINNQTQGKTFTLPDHAFVSRAKQSEIFVFCLSRSRTDEHRTRFKGVACVEICDIPAFCRRIQAALGPGATFPGRPGRTRIGHCVEYYREEDAAGTRWALPDLIATSKLDTYAWQDEFRLVFSLTNALAFENVELRLEQDVVNPGNPDEHKTHLVKAASLSDICRLHEL